MTPPMTTAVSLDMAEVHNLSLSIIDLLEDEGVTHDLGMASVALTLVRIVNPFEPLPAEKEIEFTQNLIQMVQSLGGTVN